ncbi:hypothetical protein [Dictyobacter formicarum]|nr:hypothetical protein [Dictyobacter formicarum]
MRWLFGNRSMRPGQLVTALIGLWLVMMPLASCGTITNVKKTNVLKEAPLNLNIPGDAMNSRVIGPLAGSTVLHVRITFKIDPAMMKNTQGNNLYYQAARGWDYTTGLGTPNLADFYRTMTQ